MQVPLWIDAGLITFAISSTANRIGLCPTCHEQFDRSIDPGFILIPSDLEYFINFELQDRQRRGKVGENPTRRVPTSLMYKTHQVANGTIPAESQGGLYTPIFLQEYLHCGVVPSSVLLPYLIRPKSWHGEPLAVLRRCFHILGGMRCKNLNKDTRTKLERLRNLYFFDEEEEEEEEKKSRPDSLPTQSEGVKRNEKRSFDDAQPSSHPPGQKRRQRNKRKGGSNTQVGGQLEFCPVLQRHLWHAWDLGPEVTTEEVVKRYAPIILNDMRHNLRH
jgi:hypothetical protein